MRRNFYFSNFKKQIVLLLYIILSIMNNKNAFVYFFAALCLTLAGCKKSNTATTTPAVNNCPNNTIAASGTVKQDADPCTLTGRVSITASGGTNFSYKVDNGAFQASADFSNLAPGSRVFTVKDGNCEKSITVNVPSLPAGTTFSAMKPLIQSKCALPTCHGGFQSPSFTSDCSIVGNADRIQARSIGASPTIMPPLSSGISLTQAEKNLITAWINAGKGFVN
jgi:hypothetical protein